MIEGGRGGSVVVTGSADSVQPQPSAVGYTAAKHGLMGLTKTLAVEIGPHGIRLNLVNPAAIHAPMVFGRGFPGRALAYRPDDIGQNRAVLPMPDDWVGAQRVADAVEWLVFDEASWITGIQSPVDGGWSTS